MKKVIVSILIIVLLVCAVGFSVGVLVKVNQPSDVPTDDTQVQENNRVQFLYSNLRQCVLMFSDEGAILSAINKQGYYECEIEIYGKTSPCIVMVSGSPTGSECESSSVEIIQMPDSNIAKLRIKSGFSSSSDLYLRVYEDSAKRNDRFMSIQLIFGMLNAN